MFRRSPGPPCSPVLSAPSRSASFCSSSVSDLGFSSTSAWPNSGATLGTLGVAGGIWLMLTQWIASGVGGYLAGRLRTKWAGVHTDEVFFP